MAENRVIGRDNAMPWSIKGNLAHFKEMTMGWPCIMGRKTWESLPKKPLPGRLNIVISKIMTDSSVPQNELCPPERVLSQKPSSVPQNELCPPERALFPKPSSVPKNKLCPQSQALSPRNAKIELCPQGQRTKHQNLPLPALRHRVLCRL